MISVNKYLKLQGYTRVLCVVHKFYNVLLQVVLYIHEASHTVHPVVHVAHALIDYQLVTNGVYRVFVYLF